MGNLIVQLVGLFVPIVTQIIKDRQAANGAMPTDAEIIQELNNNVEKYLEAGSNWTRAHPRPLT